MNRQDAATTKALKEIQGALNLTNEQTAYLKHFLYCMYDLGKTEKVSRPDCRRPVLMFFGGILLDEFESETQAAVKTGYSVSTICRLLKNGYKSKKGHHFKYKYVDINTTWLK